MNPNIGHAKNEPIHINIGDFPVIQLKPLTEQKRSGNLVDAAPGSF